MRSRSLIRLLPLLLLALGGAREAAAQACLSTQGSQEYCNALTAGVRFGFPRYTTAALPTCNTSNKGAVAFDTTAGSYKGCDGSTWAAIGFTGGAITSPILAPAADNCATPPYSFTGDTDTGVCQPYAGYVAIHGNGNTNVMWDGNGFQYISHIGGLVFTEGAIGAYWGSLLVPGASGALWQRNTGDYLSSHQEYHWTYTWADASNYQGGVLKTSSTGIEVAAETAGSGADNLDITLTPAGSGQVKVAHIDPAVVSGTIEIGNFQFYPDGNMLYMETDQGLIGRPDIPLQAAYFTRSIQGSKTKALTEGAATAVTQIAVPQTAGSNSADAVVQWTVYASDGTDTQTRRGSTYLAAVNKAGTETCTVGDIGTPVVAVSAGTLTCTTSCITGLTDVVQFALDCTSSLTQTSLNAMVRLDMDQPNTVTPQ